MHRSSRILVPAVVAGAALSAFGQSSFVPLGDLPGGSAFSSASGVSSFDEAGGVAGNLVVVGNSQSSNGREAFRWTAGDGLVGLGSLGGSFFFSNAAAVDATGATVVGGASAPEGILAYRWRVSTGLVSLGDLPGGTEESEASATSADGSVVVGASRSRPGPVGGEAFLWVEGFGMLGLGRLDPEDASIALGVSADGSIIVGSSGPTPDDRTPFRWTAATGLEALELLPGESKSGEASGISADGRTIVGWAEQDTQQLAVRWAADGIESLGAPAPFEDARLFAQAASEDGSVIVGWGEAGAELTAFIWTIDAGMRPLKEVLEDDFGLDLTGWSLDLALDVTVHSDSGAAAVVGVGTNPGGASEAFLAVLDPRPACPPDYDGDGELTIFDFLMFFNLFQDGDLAADFDGDGVLTIFDFLAFQNAFQDGCG
ncbi:MAG: GC-type dockerin domain-anchored protein [Phycisphaerales bacterium]